MKHTLILTLLSILLLSSSSSEQARPRMYEVRVESRIEGCIRRHNVMVEARNSTEARQKAQRIVQNKLTTRVTNTKEIRKP